MSEHSDYEAVPSTLTKVKHWLLTRLAPADYFQLDAIAGRLIDDYRAAVARGASRGVLGGILTGLAGCELAMSYTVMALPDPEPGIGEEMRLSGLLLQEVAYCATEGRGYLGVRSRELETPEIAEALRQLALSYEDDTEIGVTLTGARMEALQLAVTGVACEALSPLVSAHGYSPRGATALPGGAR